jgi:hypothetical protein
MEDRAWFSIEGYTEIAVRGRALARSKKQINILLITRFIFFSSPVKTGKKILATSLI